MIDPYTELERRIAGLDVVLDIKGLLLDGGLAAERKRRTAARQIERHEVRREVRIRRQSGKAAAAALYRACQAGVWRRIAEDIEAWRIKSRVCKADRETLGELRRADRGAHLDVVG